MRLRKTVHCCKTTEASIWDSRTLKESNFYFSLLWQLCLRRRKRKNLMPSREGLSKLLFIFLLALVELPQSPYQAEEGEESIKPAPCEVQREQPAHLLCCQRDRWAGRGPAMLTSGAGQCFVLESCPVRCGTLVVFLASAHWIPVAPLLVVTTKNVLRYCRMSPVGSLQSMSFGSRQTF